MLRDTPEHVTGISITRRPLGSQQAMSPGGRHISQALTRLPIQIQLNHNKNMVFISGCWLTANRDQSARACGCCSRDSGLPNCVLSPTNHVSSENPRYGKTGPARYVGQPLAASSLTWLAVHLSRAEYWFFLISPGVSVWFFSLVSWSL